MPFFSSTVLVGDSSSSSNQLSGGGGGGLSFGGHSLIRKRNQQQQQALQKPIKANVVVLGNAGVGKTSILLRHDGQGFTSKMSSTLGANFICSRSKIQNGRDFELQIWDTAGQERFRSMVPMYLRNKSAAIICFDITNRQSFRDLDSWIKEVERSDPSGQILLFLVGNKSDLNEARAVDEPEARQFAEQHNAHYFETSALSGKGIETAMQTIAEDVLQAEQCALKERQDELARSSFNLAPSETGDGGGASENDGTGSANGSSTANGKKGKRKKEGGGGQGCCVIL